MMERNVDSSSVPLILAHSVEMISIGLLDWGGGREVRKVSRHHIEGMRSRGRKVLFAGLFAVGSLSGGHGLVLEFGAVVLQLLVEDDALLLQILVVRIRRFQFLP
jgi:hypothetical protein